MSVGLALCADEGVRARAPKLEGMKDRAEQALEVLIRSLPIHMRCVP
jgi:hypothetical protein